MSVGVLEQDIGNLALSKSLNNSLTISNQLLQSLHKIQKDLDGNDETSLQKLPGQIKTSWNDKLQKEQKQLSSKIRKLDKTVDKVFVFEIDDIYNYKINIDEDLTTKKYIDRSIIMHLLRNGNFEQVRTLCENAEFPIPVELISKFEILYDILKELSVYELNRAINWCDENQQKLLEIGSDIEFQLYKLRFIQIFIDDKFEGLKFARLNFPKFGTNHLDVISKLISTIMIYDDRENLKTTQYYHQSFAQLSNNFIQIFCSIQGLSPESPIYSTLISSFLSLPNFIKFNKLITMKKLDWSTKNELPFEIKLPDFLKFHSIFICPVSKEETTIDNPPRVLPCNHILSQSTVMNLSKNNLNSSFKCPYCPKITRQLETKLVKFVNI